MSEKINTSNESKPARPPVSPEQLAASRVALAQLIRRASAIEPELMAELSTETGELERTWTRQEAEWDRVPFNQNAMGGDIILPAKPGEINGWAYAYNGEPVEGLEKIGLFEIATGIDEEDSYDFYVDGNIEKSRSYLPGPGAENVIEHVSWLTPAETEQLAIQIENSAA